MATHLTTGRTGEDIACLYLEEHGYIICERNWQYKHREVDIIAQQGNVLVFVEVKTRLRSAWGRAMDAVDKAKAQRLVEAADYYIRLKGRTEYVRFDIIGIDYENDGSYQIEHAPEAFYPSLRKPSKRSSR